jgi:O-antigen ligase
MIKRINLKSLCTSLASLILLLLPTYLIRFKIFSVPTTFLELYIYFVFLLFLLERFVNKEKILITSKKIILPALLLLIALITSFTSADKITALGQWKAYFFDGILALTIFYSYRDELAFKVKSLNCYLFSALFVSLWGILQHFNILGLIHHQTLDASIAAQLLSGRIMGPFEGPNYLAMYIAPAIILLLVAYFHRDDFQYLKNYIFPLLIIFVVTIILTQSASAIIAIILTMAIYFISTSKNKFKWLYGALLLIFLALSVYFLVNHSGKSGSVAARKEIYSAAIRISEEHPLLGIGMGNFENSFQTLPIDGRLNYEAPHPHDIFLAFGVYMGIGGLILFLALMSGCLRRENFQNNKIYYFVLVLILLNGLTDTTIFKNDLAIIFWYFVAFLL